MTGKTFYEKACRTSPPGRRQHSWAREQQEQCLEESNRSPGKLLGWSAGGRGGGQWVVERDNHWGQQMIQSD